MRYFEYSDFLYDTEVDPDLTINVIENITSSVNLQRKIVRVEIPINKTNPTVGAVVVAISRDARSTNLNDTLGTSIVITDVNVVGKRWRL